MKLNNSLFGIAQDPPDWINYLLGLINGEPNDEEKYQIASKRSREKYVPQQPLILLVFPSVVLEGFKGQRRHQKE